jgi:DNA-binding CsgD family transcriptional regulator
MNQTGVAAPKSPKSDFYDAVRIRLRAVIDCLDESADSHEEKSERVLMDVDFDGRRYLLVRMPPAASNTHWLSPREVEIVRLVAQGHPNKVIAAVLDISAWTVCTHVRRVFMKLGVTSRAAMVARAAEFVRQAEIPLHAPVSGTWSPRQLESQGAAPDRTSPFTRDSGQRFHVRDAGSLHGRDEAPVRRRSAR